MLMPLVSVSPDWIVYWNSSEALPEALVLLPEVYAAGRFVLPTTMVSVGLPLALSTMTAEGDVSLKMVVTDTTSVAFTKSYCLFVALVIATLLIVGGVVSTM